MIDNYNYYDDDLWKPNNKLGFKYNPWWQFDRDEDNVQLSREETVYHLGVDDGLSFGDKQVQRLSNNIEALSMQAAARERVLQGISEELDRLHNEKPL